MFFKLLRYDIREGTIHQYIKYIIAAIIFLIFCIDFYMKRFHMFHNNFQDSLNGTFADYIFYCFGGMNEYIPDVGNSFRFPVLWMSLYLVLLYMNMNYPYNNAGSAGQNILVRANSRQAWWLSKCLWSILSIIIFFMIGWAVIFFFSFMAKAEISLVITKEYMYPLLDIKELSETPSSGMIIILFILPLFVAIAVNLLQMTLSLLIKPIYSFIIIVSLLLSSAYYSSPWLIGNYAMVVRSEGIISKGFQPWLGIISCFFLSIGSVITGSMIFKQYDIVNRD